MFFLYNFLLTVLGILALPWFLVKLLTTDKYRAGLAQRLGAYPAETLRRLGERSPIWVHAVSVGETIAAIPLVRELRLRYPERAILVTTVTATGQRTARSQVPEADAVLFFPFDLPWIVRRFCDRLRPALFLIIETEIWPNCIRTLHDRGVPVVVVNGRISRDSYRGYRRVRPFMTRVLRMVSAFSMQTVADADRVRALGAPADRVRNAGNIKFDCAVSPLDGTQRAELRRACLLPESGPVLVAGSTHAGEEAMVLDAYRGLVQEFPGLLLVLAPRHPERTGEVEALLRERGLAYQKRSLPEAGRSVLLVDTVGELSRLYAVATVAFVGGSLVPAGGHNILEPGVYGVPVVFGPHMENFPEISEVMRERGAGIALPDAGSLQAVLRDLLGDAERRRAMGEAAAAVIRDNRGALQKTLELVAGFLPA